MRPEDEIARRVHRYAEALLRIVAQRPEEERMRPISAEEGALARQVAEAVTAYKRSLRAPSLPSEPRPAEPAQPPASLSPRPRRARARGGVISSGAAWADTRTRARAA